MSARIRIALVDDQELVREGIKSLLALSGKVDVVLEAAHGDALLARFDPAGVDVVVMDMRMPVRDGVGTLRELRRRGEVEPRAAGLEREHEERDRLIFLKSAH